MNREGISQMIMDILGARKTYVLVPKRISQHIVAAIERPKQFDSNYRTNSLISYLKERRMQLVVDCDMFAEEIIIDSSEKVHYAVRRGLEFFGISESDLINEGIAYHTTKDSSVSISIDRFCDIMNRFSFEIIIRECNR